MTYFKVRSFIFLASVFLFEGCGINIFNFSESDRNEIRFRECSQASVYVQSSLEFSTKEVDTECECLINKLTHKYSSINQLRSLWSGGVSNEEYLEVKNQCYSGTIEPTPTPIQLNN